MKIRRALAFASRSALAALLLAMPACDKMQAPRTPTPGGNVGAQIDDGILSARVAAALLANLSTRSYGFKVEAQSGAVHLSGSAASQADIDRAVETARGVAGVKTVAADVAVRPPDATAGSRIDDGILTARVKTALLADSNVRGLGIGVATSKGEVQLSGFVDSQGQRERALQIAHGIEGVRSVDDRMKLRQ